MRWNEHLHAPAAQQSGTCSFSPDKEEREKRTARQKGSCGRKLTAVSPGGERRQVDVVKQTNTLCQVCMRLLFNHRSLSSEFTWTAVTTE
ncbi:hypothetical protein JOB18_003513 [Solea senegalensis]|uniref:Uncharacterized protein n=1 Tax=Solea senegalensis TaxID=28829 RepID=A0AAV6RYB6_SOLSE|nr:hypothetical protein JOB18_003513 [Solea senegalensis]